MFRDSSSSLTTLCGITLTRFFTRSSDSGPVVWKLTPSFPSRDGSALTASLNPSAFDVTTFKFPPLIGPTNRHGKMPATRPGRNGCL